MMNLSYNLIIFLQLVYQFYAEDASVYVPGYDIKIYGINNKVGNTYIDDETGIEVDCPEHCITCINQFTCTSCQFGYFLFPAPVSNNKLCVQCPMFDITQQQNFIRCADCVTQPLIWSESKRCTYKYEKITDIPNSPIIRFERIEHEPSIYFVYHEKNVEEFVGGYEWCGEVNRYDYTCQQFRTDYVVDYKQNKVRCRQGYNYDNYQCIKCPENCSKCVNSEQNTIICSSCNTGYALGLNNKCELCSTIIPNCYDCYYGKIDYNFEDHYNDIQQYKTPQSLIDAEIFPRCRACGQKNKFYIPSKDLKQCEDCSDANCISCRYAQIFFNDIQDHSKDPQIIPPNEIDKYQKYCLNCIDSYFISFEGKCEKCDIKDCELCYYGEETGINKQYTLQSNFIYRTEQGSLKKMCASCKYEVEKYALMTNGSCQQQTDLGTKDENCMRWKQIANDQFECIECKLDYGFNASLDPVLRKCDKKSIIFSIPNCLSFYYTLINNKEEGISCKRCKPGFVASAKYGCINCSTGKPATISSDEIVNCKGCSLLTQSGLNFTHIMLTEVIGKTKGKLNQKQSAIAAENNYLLNYEPYCDYCGIEKVSNKCLNQCQDKCYSQNNYSACQTVKGQQKDSNQCKFCGKQQYLQLWNLNLGISDDSLKCIQCPRYCLFCVERSEKEFKEINPYFSPINDDFLKYRNKCLTCRTISDVCDDYTDTASQQGGLNLSCTSEGQMNYITFYDPSINQCTPCPGSTSCNRIIKVQQIIECRPLNKIKPSDPDQNIYYQSENANGMTKLSHLFSASVIFLDSWNPTQPLDISFPIFDGSMDNQTKIYLALNDESVSDIEFEILLIPNEETHNTGSQEITGKSCVFPNDVNFSVSLSKYIANIKKLSLTFKTIDPTSGIIGNDLVNIFMTSFSFKGWNYFEFNKINFLPAYSIKTSAPLKQMLFKFSDNLFKSKLYLKEVTFISGVDDKKQEALIKSFNAIFSPVLDISNFYFVSIYNVKIDGFQYQQDQSFFKLDKSKFDSIPSLQLQIKKLTIKSTSFKKVDFINIFYNNVQLTMEDTTFDSCSMYEVNIIKQAPGYTNLYSQHSITLLGYFKIKGSELKSTTIIDAYNLQILSIADLQILPEGKGISSEQPYSLFTSNMYEIGSFQILIKDNESDLDFKNMRIFSLPLSTSNIDNPRITIKTIKINKVIFNLDGSVFKILTYPMLYDIKTNVDLDDITIESKFKLGFLIIIQLLFIQKQFQDCQTENRYTNYMMSFIKVSVLQIKSLKILNYYGGLILYIDQTDQITIQSGYSKLYNSISDWTDIEKEETEENGEKKNKKFLGNINNIPSQTGTVFYIKNLKNRFYLKDFTFQYQYVVDKSIIMVDHEKKIETPDNQSDITDTFLKEAIKRDNFGTDIPMIVLTGCKFLNIGVYVSDPFIISSVIYIKTMLKYRIVLNDLTITDITGYTYLDNLFKDSSSFFMQDSKDSSLYLNKLEIKGLTSNGIQNGFFVQTNYFTCLQSNFQDGNQNIKSEDSFSGGFLHVIGSNILIDFTNFRNSISDKGGAIFLNGFGNTLIVISNCEFEKTGTTLRTEGYGKGGAISIDGSSSPMSLTIMKSTFKNTIAFKQSGFLDLSCGNQVCITKIEDGTFENNYATSGSLFNIKYNKPTQKLTFSKNKISFNLKADEILKEHQYNTQQEVEEELNKYYMIVVLGGEFISKANIFQNLNLFQGLMYLSGGKVNDEENKFLSSSFIFSPVVYYYKQTIDKLQSLQIKDVKQNNDDIKKLKQNNDDINKNQLKFLQTITNFDQFFVIENPLNNFDASNINIDNVHCISCINGIFGVVKSTKISIFTKFIFKKCESKFGSLYLSGIEPTNPNSGRMLQTSPLITLIDGEFQGNTASFGGGIYVSYISLTMEKTTLISNSVNQYGGGVYFITTESKTLQNKLTLLGCTITQNSANMGGGGVKIIGNFIEKDPNTHIKQNTAKGSGANIQEYPFGFKVFYKGKEVQNDSQQKIIFENWASGVATDQELRFQLIGEDKQIQILDSGQTATLTVELDYNSLSETPEDAKITGTSTVNYDTVSQSFILDKVMFQKIPGESLNVKVTSSAIKIKKNNQNDAELIYKLPMTFTMRKCIIGEAFIQSSGVCFKCDKETYSLIEGSKYCIDCPEHGVDSCPGGNKMELKSGYWRSDESTDKIESCSNQPSNCHGSLDTGDNSCAEGHIGALCEECDISARYWPESYSHSSEFSCGKCSEVTGNSLKMVALSIYTLIAILFSVKSTKAMLDSYIITFYFQQVGFLQKRAVQSQEAVGIIIKLFTTYVQLIIIIATFKMKLPPGLNEISVNVGDPVSQMTFSLDCGLYSISGDIPMTYFRLIWSQLMPIMYVCSYLIVFFIFQLIKREKSKSVVAWISFIYIYISMQPSIVRQNIQSVSCRTVGGHQYIKSNVSELCYTPEHIKWSLLLILPTLIVWVVLIPAFFFWQMYKGREKLKSIRMQYRFGFLYSEYKTQSYFWELIKIFQKTLVIIFINVYDAYHNVKGVLVILVLLVYINLSLKYKPYLESRFNQLDIKSNITVITSIIIALFILNNPYAYLIWIGYILLFLINILFVFKLLRILISGYTQKFEAKLGDFYYKIAVKFPRLAKLLNLPLIQRSRINFLWKRFRNYVKDEYFKKDQATDIGQEDEINKFNEKLAIKLSKKESKHLSQNQIQVKIIDDEENQDVLYNSITPKPKNQQNTNERLSPIIGSSPIQEIKNHDEDELKIPSNYYNDQLDSKRSDD